MFQKFNWHQKKYQNKKRELEKRAPHWFTHGKKVTTKHLRQGTVTILLEKLDITPIKPKDYTKLYGDIPLCRYKLIISAPWYFRDYICYYEHKPEYSFLGQHNTQQFITNILPIIPDDILSESDKRILLKTAYQYESIQQLPNKHKQIRQKLYRERHWYSGMIKESTGRSTLRNQIKKSIAAYNNVLKQDTSTNLITLSGNELVEVFICDCEDCLNMFGQPTVIDETLLTNHNAILAIEDAEKIDLKQDFERWEYKY